MAKGKGSPPVVGALGYVVMIFYLFLDSNSANFYFVYIVIMTFFHVKDVCS